MDANQHEDAALNLCSFVFQDVYHIESASGSVFSAETAELRKRTTGMTVMVSCISCFSWLSHCRYPVNGDNIFRTNNFPRRIKCLSDQRKSQ